MFLQSLLLFIFLYFFVRPIYLAFFYTHPPRLRISFFTPTSLGVEYDDVTLSSRDGVDLRGWYVHSRNGAAVLLLHGHSGNRLAVLHQAEALIRAGYGVLMMDLRAHGHSGGRLFVDAFRENAWLADNGVHLLQVVALVVMLAAMWLLGREGNE